METIADYKARILSYIEGKNPLEVQRKTPELLADLVHAGAIVQPQPAPRPLLLRYLEPLSTPDPLHPIFAYVPTCIAQ
jgi:hypothetical protein